MKKRIALFFAVMLSFGAFALTACTDKNKPRELDSVEQSIVGTWKSINSDATLTFNSDGTWTGSNYVKTRQFKHSGDGIHGELGHFEIIDGGPEKRALFDIYPNRLYYISLYDGEILTNTYDERQ